MRTQEPRAAGRAPREHRARRRRRRSCNSRITALAGADPRQPALDLLTRILTDGDASRLHRVLVEEQKLAISADSYVDRGFDPGLAWFLLVAARGRRYAARPKRPSIAEIERLRQRTA